MEADILTAWCVGTCRLDRVVLAKLVWGAALDHEAP